MSPASAAEPVSQELTDAKADFDVPSGPADSSAEEGAAGGLVGKVKELAQDAAALADRVREMAERAAIRVDKVIESAAAVAERVGELTGGAAATLADWVQELAKGVADQVAAAVVGAVSRLLDGAPARGPPAPADAPLVPPATPASGAPAPARGSFSGASFSGGFGNDYDPPLEELAVLAIYEIALMLGGKLSPLSGSVLGPASAFLPTVERPG